MGWVAKKACQVMRDGKPVEIEPGAPLPEAAEWAAPWVNHRLAVAEFVNKEESAPEPAPKKAVEEPKVTEPEAAPAKPNANTLFGGGKKSRKKRKE